MDTSIESPMTASFTSPDAWDYVEPVYTSLFMPTLVEYSRAAVSLAGPGADAHVLDVAAGPGTLTLLVASSVGRVSAIDFSPAMIDRLRREAAARGLANVEATVGDGQALPYSDATFDAAFSMFGLIFFPDRGLGLRELVRVLRTGGRAVIGAWAPLGPDAPFVTLLELLRAELPEVLPAFSGLPLADDEAMTRELADAGFAEVQVTRVVHDFVAASPEAFWHDQARANVLVTAVRRSVSSDVWQRTADRVLRGLSARLGDGEVRYPQTAVLGLGTRPERDR